MRDPEQMLGVLNRALPQLADGKVRITGFSAQLSKSRSSIRAGRLDVVYSVRVDVDSESREHVVLGVAPVTPAFLEELGEQRHLLRDHPWLAPFREAAVYDEESRFALLLFPLDPALRGLADVTGREADRVLGACLPECRAGARIERVESKLVRYKAFGRAVLRVRLVLRGPRGGQHQSTVYAKLLADESGAECFRCLTALWAATRNAAYLRLPEPLGYDSDRRMLVSAEAPGREDLADWIKRLKEREPLPSGVDMERLGRCAVVLARALLELQRSGIRPETRRTFHYELERVKRDRDLLLLELRRSPELATRVDALIERLTALAPANEVLVPAHGDLEYHQLIGDERSLTLVDWDGISLANPVFDAANFLARLLRECRRRPGFAPELEEMGRTFRRAFLEGQPQLARDLDLYEGLLLTQLVLRSFRGPTEGASAAQETWNMAAAAMEFLEKASGRPR